jgi:hypothetical protein
VVHAFLEALPALGRIAALAKVPLDHHALCAAIDPAEVPAGLTEVPFALDLDTMRVVRPHSRKLASGHRAYVAPGPGRWIFGTADVVEHAPKVWDYKVTDVPHDERSRRAPAGQSKQLRFFGLSAARVFSWDSVDVGHIFVRSDGYLDKRDRATLGFFDLLAIEEDVKAIADRVEAAGRKGAPDVHPGEHCALCPAAVNCPATRGVVEMVGPYLDSTPPDATPAQAWMFLRRVETFAALLRAELVHQASIAPIELPSGKVVCAVDETREELDARIVHEVITAAYGPDAPWPALRATKAGLQEVTGGGAAMRSLLTEIRTRGGSRKVALRVVRETAPELPALPPVDWDGVDELDFAALATGPHKEGT